MIGPFELDSIVCDDALAAMGRLPDGCVHMCVTSPPYWGQRDYGIDGQLGLEKTPEEYVEHLVEIMQEVRRVLRDDGTLWLNMGDSYASTGRSDRKESPGVGAKQAMKAPGRSLKWKAGGGSNFSWAIPSFGTLLKPKDLCGIPWRVAFALQADGWWLRSDIIWHKPNCMPESVRDRPTKGHEYVFLLAKSKQYYYDQDAIREPITESTIERGRYGWNGRSGKTLEVGARSGSSFRRLKTEGITMADVGMANPAGRNRRTVWTIATQPYSGAHFATFPEALIEPCIKAGCPTGGIVLDPFMGAGTTAIVALENGRHFLGIELNPDYVRMANERAAKVDGIQLALLT